MAPTYLYILISFLVTVWVTPFLRYFAHRYKILDIPDGKIKTHHKPIPYLGGLAIFLGFGASLFLPLGNLSFDLTFYLCGLILLFLAGMIDDFYPVSAGTKFVLQIGAVFLFLHAGLVLHFAFLPIIINYFISMFWMLSVINAFNLIDIMDGLATLIGSIIIFNFMLVLWYLKYASMVLLLLSFLGALLGFLLYNRPPATIYLGDAGSLLLGGFIATLPFSFSWQSFGPFGFLVPVILCIVPALEVATLVLLRTYKKIPFWYASSDHFAQILLRKGWKKNDILLYLVALGFFQALLVFGYITKLLTSPAFCVLFFFLLLVWYLVVFIPIKLKLKEI